MKSGWALLHGCLEDLKRFLFLNANITKRRRKLMSTWRLGGTSRRIQETMPNVVSRLTLETELRYKKWIKQIDLFMHTNPIH
jgi:hypothetical protein